MFTESTDKVSILRTILAPILPRKEIRVQAGFKIQLGYDLNIGHVSAYLIRHQYVTLVGGIRYIEKHAPVDRILELDNKDVLFFVKNHVEEHSLPTFLWPLVPFNTYVWSVLPSFPAKDLLMISKMSEKQRSDLGRAGELDLDSRIPFWLFMIKKTDPKILMEMETRVRLWIRRLTGNGDNDALDPILHIGPDGLKWEMEGRTISTEDVLMLVRGIEDLILPKKGLQIRLVLGKVDDLGAAYWSTTRAGRVCVTIC